MAQGTLSPTPRFQWFDNAGVPLSSGKFYSYAAGTSSAQATYSDVGLTTQNDNPITLNSAGRPCSNNGSGPEVPIFLTPGQSYKFVLTNALGTTIWTQDNCEAVPLSAAALDIVGTWGENVSAGDAVYLSDGSGAKTAGRWYIGSTANAYSSSASEMGFAIADGLAGETGSIRQGGQVSGLSGLVAGTQYYLSTAGGLSVTAGARFMGQADSTTTLIASPNPIPSPPNVGVLQARLTLTTGVAVTTSNVTAATTIYLTPYGGNRVALYDGANWLIRPLTEISIAVPANTSQLYDIFVYDNAGTPTLELLAWTNDTTRATALTTQDGVLVKTGALTRRYVGSVRTTGVANQTEDSLTKRYLWNYYNRVRRPLVVEDTTNTWNYSTAAYQQANASAANQVDVVVGVAEVMLNLRANHIAINDTQNVAIYTAIGEDSATVATAGQIVVPGIAQQVGGADWAGAWAVLEKYPAVGRHFYAWLERATATGVTTWLGDNGDATITQTGLIGWYEA